MNIQFSPLVTDAEFVCIKAGNSVVINNEVFDFSRMKEGDTLPMTAIAPGYFDGDVHYIDGHLNLVIKFPIPANYSQAQAFPVPLLNVSDGVVPLPIGLPKPITHEGEDMDNE